MADAGNELFLSIGVPYLAASEFMRDPKLQEKAIDYPLEKATSIIHKVGSKAINQLSTKVRPNYSTKLIDLILMVVLSISHKCTRWNCILM